MNITKTVDILFEIIDVVTNPKLDIQVKLSRIYELTVSTLDSLGYVEKPQ